MVIFNLDWVIWRIKLRSSLKWENVWIYNTRRSLRTPINLHCLIRLQINNSHWGSVWSLVCIRIVKSLTVTALSLPPGYLACILTQFLLPPRIYLRKRNGKFAKIHEAISRLTVNYGWGNILFRTLFRSLTKLITR